MANVLAGNFSKIDTTANDIITDGVLIHYVTYTASSSGGEVILLDDNGGSEVIRFEGATANDTKYVDYSLRPLHLPNGLHATVSNCVATIIYSKVGR